MKKILLSALVAMIPYTAAAQQSCAPRDVVVEHLKELFSATRQSIGLADGNAVVETWAAADNGDWFITVTLDTGMTCLFLSGNSFQRFDEQAPAALGDKT